MELQYLEFDCSEDTEGVVCWDALAQPAASHTAALLREVWRVLAPGGRMIAVIPNRRGMWVRTDTTPFGHGRPYSRAQITQLLRHTWFTPASWGEALFMPPVAKGWFLRSAMAWKRAGEALSMP